MPPPGRAAAGRRPGAPEGEGRQTPDLIVTGYEDPQTARQAYGQVQRPEQDFIVGLLEPGHAAVVIMASKITGDRFAGAMQPSGGTILKTPLPEGDERELAGQG